MLIQGFMNVRFSFLKLFSYSISSKRMRLIEHFQLGKFVLLKFVQQAILMLLKFSLRFLICKLMEFLRSLLVKAVTFREIGETRRCVFSLQLYFREFVFIQIVICSPVCHL